MNKGHFRQGIIITSLLFMLSACQTTRKEPDIVADADYVMTMTDVRVDSDTEETWIVTPPYFPEGRYGYQVSLIARIPESGEPRYQVYLFSNRVEWAFFEEALAPDGTKLEVEHYGRKVGGDYDYEERIGSWVSKEQLESAAENGNNFELVFLGRGGQQPVSIPPYYVEGFLKKLERFEQRDDI